MSDISAENAFLDLEFPVEVWLASEEVPMGTLLELEPGGILPLAKDPDGPVDLMVNGAWVASGELVVVDGKFGFKVTATTRERLEAIEAEKDTKSGTEEPATSDEQGENPESTEGSSIEPENAILADDEPEEAENSDDPEGAES